MELRMASRTEVPGSPTVGMISRVKAMRHSGVDVISLGAGEPGFVTPEHIRDFAKKALDEGHTFYSDSAGLVELRTAIAEKTKRDNRFDVDPNSEVLVTVGGKEAVFDAMMASLDPGDEVILTDPCWVSYEPCVTFAGGVPVKIPLLEESGFKMDTAKLKKSVTPKTKLIVVNSPNNPTGGVMEKSDLDDVAEIAIEKDLAVLSDELYEYLIYDGMKHTSIASLPGMKDRTITVNGFSKAFAMTGWRLGYMIADKRIISRVKVIHEHSVTGPATFVQRAAALALHDQRSWQFVNEMRVEYEKRRNVVMEELARITGFSCTKPRGAFYAFPDVSQLGKTSVEMSDLLLERARVATIPGVGFGEAGEGHIRLTFANPEDDLREALRRIRDTVELL